MRSSAAAYPICLAAALTIAAPGARAQGIDELPKVVQAEVRKADASCRKLRGRPRYEPLDLVKAEDISADGVEDFFIDYSAYACRGSGQIFCGSGGCTLQIFLSAGRNRWAKAFDELVQGFSLAQEQGRAVAAVEVGGLACGRSRSETCKRRIVASGTTLRDLD